MQNTARKKKKPKCPYQDSDDCVDLRNIVALGKDVKVIFKKEKRKAKSYLCEGCAKIWVEVE